MNYHNQQANWQYGYTLGPPTAANRGNYTTYYGHHQYQQHQQHHYTSPPPPVPPATTSNSHLGPSATSTPVFKTPLPVAQPKTTSAAGQAQTWGDVKPKLPSTFKAKVFVTATSLTPPVNSPPVDASSSAVTAPTTEAERVADLESCNNLHELCIFNRLVESYEFAEVTTANNTKSFKVKPSVIFCHVISVLMLINF